MLIRFHREITEQALWDCCTPTTLAAIIRANTALDGLRGQIGHPEYHFDANAFEESRQFMAEQEEIILSSLRDGVDRMPAWQAFGRLSHAAQDLYAHSNYVALWLKKVGTPWPAPEDIDPLDESILHSPELRSGRLYYPVEILAFIPWLETWARRILPRDSHAWLNLDHPGRGPLFPYARAAAIQRTRYEWNRIARRIRTELGKIPSLRFSGHLQ